MDIDLTRYRVNPAPLQMPQASWLERFPALAPSNRVSPRLVFNPRRSLPAYSLLVGACEDGLPLLLDLLSPTAGPVLVAGDVGCGKTALLQSICGSALQLNGPAEVRPLIITARPDEWRSVDGGRAYIIDARDDTAVSRQIIELGALLEQRREVELPGPAVVLFIDDLSALLDLNLSLQAQLHWLLDQGPAGRIWAICSLETQQALNLHYWVSLFHSRLIGRISWRSAARELALHPGLNLDRTVDGGQFAFHDRNGWHGFWAVDPARPAATL